jgi:hypothetical protein
MMPCPNDEPEVNVIPDPWQLGNPQVTDPGQEDLSGSEWQLKGPRLSNALLMG